MNQTHITFSPFKASHPFLDFGVTILQIVVEHRDECRRELENKNHRVGPLVLHSCKL